MGREQVILDPGIGFGKTPEHNLRVARGGAEFYNGMGARCCWVFRANPLSGNCSARNSRRGCRAALACACLAVAAGAQIIRAHDVAETVQAIRMTEAILAKSERIMWDIVTNPLGSRPACWRS